MKASIFVLVDALGWEWIKEHPFLKEVAPYRRPLDSVLGFSTAAIPSILTGRFPEEHGRLSLFHRANGHSPFAKLKLICAMPPAMVENRYVRYGVKTVARRMNHLSGYFQLYGIPLSYLPKLDVCEKRNIYAPGGIPDSTSIFDLLQGGGKSYKTYCYHDGTDDQLLARIEADLVAGQANFYFLYLAGLDAFLHAHADDREASAGMLEKYSSALARLYGIAEKTYGAAEIHVFGDHGMAPTEATIDIQAILARLPVKAARDYLCLLDSTMARFWFFSPRARELVTMALNNVDGGEWLEAEDLVALHAYFADGKYGEQIFLTQSGTVIAPCHMGVRAPAGMHGFLPSSPHSRSAFVSSVDYGDSLKQITDIFGVMKAHV